MKPEGILWETRVARFYGVKCPLFGCKVDMYLERLFSKFFIREYLGIIFNRKDTD